MDYEFLFWAHLKNNVKIEKCENMKMIASISCC